MSQTLTVIFPGRVCLAPEQRGGEKAPHRYKVAVNMGKKVDGQWTETPKYVRCVDFDADRAKKLTVGSLVSVTGTIDWDQRPEDQGGGYYEPEVKVRNLDILLWAGDPKGNKPAAAERKGKTEIPF